MPKLRVHGFTISLDGYAAGPDQSQDNPLGVGGERLHEWSSPPAASTGSTVRRAARKAASTTCPPLEMRGGTTFHFVDGGIEAALERALEAAGGQDVLVGGGAATIQQYLRAGLIDEMHVAIAPILLGAGERLFDHLDGGPVGYECVELVSSPAAAHVRLVKAGAKS